MQALLIRVATPSERTELEQLQLRASLGNAGDRDALLAHPDAIRMLSKSHVAGSLFSEFEEDIVGFASIEPRDDGDSDLDAMFVEPRMQRRGIGRALVEYCGHQPERRGHAPPRRGQSAREILLSGL